MEEGWNFMFETASGAVRERQRGHMSNIDVRDNMGFHDAARRFVRASS